MGINPLTWFGGGGVGGAAKGVGSAVGGVAKIFTVGKDAHDQRKFDSYASARGYVPQGWLAKQIRPLVTLTVLSTFIMLNVTICVLVFLSIKRFIALESDDMAGLIKEVATIFTLLAAPGLLYYTFVGTIMTFWFGGQAQKYGIAHKQSQADAERAHTRAGGVETANDATAGNTTPTDPHKPPLDPEIEAFNKATRDDFFARQARDR